MDAAPPLDPAPRARPPLIRLGRHLRDAFDRLIAASSLVANDPVLDVRAFPWTAALRRDWRAIREEAGSAAGAELVLWGHGRRIDANAARCPRTAALVATIPGLDSAIISTLPPGAHVPAHRGATKGLITCHLGLAVPRDGDVRMRVADRTMRWSEGETLVFDDTYRHESWNEAAGPRVVLLVRFARPLRNPGKWIAELLRRHGARAAFGRWPARSRLIDA